MQTKDQARKTWKVVTAAAAVGTLSLGSLALANPGSNSSDPQGITLRDPAPVTQSVTSSTIPNDLRIGDDSVNTGLDSPFDDDTVSVADASISVQSTQSVSVESPVSTQSVQSAQDSPVSVQSADDSPVSVQSADDSPESADAPESADSPDSADSDDGSADS